jgi:DNA-directed RNA polymerase subunit M/transcription elongation factor TFIIS
MTIDRNQGKTAISTVTSELDIDAIEQAVYDKVTNAEDYKIVIYQVVSDILSKKSEEIILKNIQSEEILWKHDCYGEMSARIKEQNEFIENPFEIEEGIHTCKCGSKRVYSYNKQCRGGDEGTSVFCECVACHSKWTEKG